MLLSFVLRFCLLIKKTVAYFMNFIRKLDISLYKKYVCHLDIFKGEIFHCQSLVLLGDRYSIVERYLNIYKIYNHFDFNNRNMKYFLKINLMSMDYSKSFDKIF